MRGELPWEPPGYSENSTCATGVLKQDDLKAELNPTQQDTSLESWWTRSQVVNVLNDMVKMED